MKLAKIRADKRITETGVDVALYERQNICCNYSPEMLRRSNDRLTEGNFSCNHLPFNMTIKRNALSA